MCVIFLENSKSHIQYSKSHSPFITSPRELAFSSDGTKFFIVGFQGKDVNEYHMPTPWDVSTATYDSKFGPSGLQSNTHGLAFSSDRTKMYTIGSGQAVWE
jgi:DNA-binding beta-propeller fold protein YncE